MVQGLGNVGYHAAKFCREGGALIIAIAEREGAILNLKGLDEGAVFEHRKQTGSILGFPGATNLPDTAAALELECDVLLPAALEGVLTADNARRVKARIILEGANGPTTPEADPIFREKGVLVIPDIYCNAGGVTVSYFEWLKNLSHVRFGRLSKRHEQANELQMLKAIEKATGTHVLGGRTRRDGKGTGRSRPGELGPRGDDDQRLPRAARDTAGPSRDPRPANRGVRERDPQGGAQLHGTGDLSIGTGGASPLNQQRRFNCDTPLGTRSQQLEPRTRPRTRT